MKGKNDDSLGVAISYLVQMGIIQKKQWKGFHYHTGRVIARPQWPGCEAQIMPERLVHVLTEPVDVLGGQPRRYLQILIRQYETPYSCVPSARKSACQPLLCMDFWLRIMLEM